MNDQANTPFAFVDFDAMNDSTKASFRAMSETYVAWLKNANRLQAEAIRFVSDRFNKDVQILTRFAGCKKPEEFLSLQSEAATELVNDYLEEGAKWVALLGDGIKGKANVNVKGK